MGKTVLFGRYRLEEPLGAGGSAQVWRATDTRTGDTVAVKRLHPLVFADEAGRERLLREFRALRDLDEAHIVRVRDLELTDDDGALILDYIAGPSLATRLADDDRLSTAEAVSIALDVAAALAAAHAAGIVHRDVTPGNILLDPDDGARLTDFGIALGGAGTNGEPALTATGQLVGTLRYLAPEQLRGAPADPASDVHALAAVLYEMLAGRPAYPAASPVALAEAQARGVDPIPSVPPALDQAVRRGLAPDPADRPADAAAFAADIQAAIAADRTEPIAPALRSSLAIRHCHRRRRSLARFRRPLRPRHRPDVGPDCRRRRRRWSCRRRRRSASLAMPADGLPNPRRATLGPASARCHGSRPSAVPQATLPRRTNRRAPSWSPPVRAGGRRPRPRPHSPRHSAAGPGGARRVGAGGCSPSSRRAPPSAGRRPSRTRAGTTGGHGNGKGKGKGDGKGRATD